MTEKTSPQAQVLLVVDDEALIRWSLIEHLSSAGYLVHEAADGAAAMSHFLDRTPKIDLAVLDLKLPDTDGVALLRDIKRVAPDCRVILMTAFGTPDKLQEARDGGVFDIVTKPFNLDTMAGIVEQALSQPLSGSH